MSRYADPVSLLGQTVRIDAMEPEHDEALFAALDGDEEVWRYLPWEIPRSVTEMRAWMGLAFEGARAGSQRQFVVSLCDSGRVIGSTGYHAISEANRGLEIGGTWYNRALWRSSVNTECKFLLMRHAFETLGCIRVHLRTDERNERSRNAILRLGCAFEGIARHDRIVKGGFYRSSAQYSLLAEEWPARKAWFEERLAVTV